MSSIPVISVVGTSKSGKTTLVEKLVASFTARGYQVGVIKHARHFEVDYPGKDSWRYRQAGAKVVVLASAERMALMRSWQEEWPPEEIIKAMPDVDMVITEGYKWGNLPKIEVYRRENQGERVLGDAEVLAVVSDVPDDEGVPWFHLEEAERLADFLEGYLFGGRKQEV